MTRAELLTRVLRDYSFNPVLFNGWGRKTIGEALYCTLVNMSVDIRPLVCTPEDPWALQSRSEVESWIDRHMLWDDEGSLVRVTLQLT